METVLNAFLGCCMVCCWSRKGASEIAKAVFLAQLRKVSFKCTITKSTHPPFVRNPALSPATHSSGRLYATSRAGECMRKAPSRVGWYRETTANLNCRKYDNFFRVDKVRASPCQFPAKLLRRNGRDPTENTETTKSYETLVSGQQLSGPQEPPPGLHKARCM